MTVKNLKLLTSHRLVAHPSLSILAGGQFLMDKIIPALLVTVLGHLLIPK